MHQLPQMSDSLRRVLTPWIFVAALAAGAAAGDWPQYNGPASNRTVAVELGSSAWSGSSAPIVWKQPTRAGFSSFSVAEGKVFTLVSRDGAETCVALDADTGEELWAAALGTVDYDGGGGAGAGDNKGGDGPRTTPSYDEGRVYVLDANLLLACLDAQDGSRVWQHDILADFGGRQIKWQNGASPLVEGDAVFVAGGGAGQSLLAFDKQTGEVRWKSGDERMTHATPIAATFHGVRQVVFYVQSGLLAVDPERGTELWRAEYPFSVSSAASPVVWEDMIFLSAGYGVGGAAYRVTYEDEQLGVEFVWRKKARLVNHWSTPVCKDGYLYGMFSFKKYGTGPLKCVDIRTGEERWSTDGFGPGNVILVGSDVVALGDAGQLVLVEATPDAYRERARADVLEGKCWSSPAFADGQLYVRSTVEGARIDLTAGAAR